MEPVIAPNKSNLPRLNQLRHDQVLTRKRPIVTALQHPGVTERIVSNMEWVIIGGANDHMIDQVDADDLRCLPQLTGELNVGGTRRWIAAYAVCGISGVMPHRFLCRMTGASPFGLGHLDAA